MIENFEILAPEIFLSISIMIILMIGVFLKNSYNIVTNLTYLVLIILIVLFIGIIKTFFLGPYACIKFFELIQIATCPFQ